MKRVLSSLLVFIVVALCFGPALPCHAEQGAHWMTWQEPCGENCVARYERVGDVLIVEYWCCGQHGWTGGYVS